MNAERLHIIARAVQDELRQTNLVGRLSEVFAIGVEKETGSDMLLGDDCLF